MMSPIIVYHKNRICQQNRKKSSHRQGVERGLTTGRRYYNLRGIKIDLAGGIPNASASYDTVPNTRSIYSIADVYEFVKTKIKKTEVLGRGNTENGVTQQPRSVNISIAEIFKKINPSDKIFLKHILDGFLDEKQKAYKKSRTRGP